MPAPFQKSTSPRSGRLRRAFQLVREVTNDTIELQRELRRLYPGSAFND